MGSKKGIFRNMECGMCTWTLERKLRKNGHSMYICWSSWIRFGSFWVYARIPLPTPYQAGSVCRDCHTSRLVKQHVSVSQGAELTVSDSDNYDDEDESNAVLTGNIISSNEYWISPEFSFYVYYSLDAKKEKEDEKKEERRCEKKKNEERSRSVEASSLATLSALLLSFRELSRSSKALPVPIRRPKGWLAAMSYLGLQLYVE